MNMEKLLNIYIMNEELINENSAEYFKLKQVRAERVNVSVRSAGLDTCLSVDKEFLLEAVAKTINKHKEQNEKLKPVVDFVNMIAKGVNINE